MKRHSLYLRCDIRPRSFGIPWLERITVRRSVVGSACHWHRHDEHEIIFLLSGDTTYAFRRRLSVKLTGGSFLVIPKGLEHHMLDDIDAPSFRLGFNLSTDPSVSAAPLRRDEFRETLGALLTTRLTARPFSAATRANLLALTKLIAAHSDDAPLGPIARARFRSLCALVLADCAEDACARRLSGEPPATRTRFGEENIGEAIDFIDRHAEQPLDLKALVEYMGYSRSRLFALFRKRTGLSPAAYHQRQRLARAQHLLDTTDLTSEQVAARLGFESPAYFSYAFRRACGMTPIAFRNRKA